MKQSSKNFIRYKGRHIRHYAEAIPGRGDLYLVAWSEFSSDRRVFHGTLKELIVKIDDTEAFWGRWEFLL